MTAGMRVLDISGQFVGEVVKVEDGRFLVQRDDRKAWLHPEAVFTVSEGRVTLICTTDGVENYELPDSE